MTACRICGRPIEHRPIETLTGPVNRWLAVDLEALVVCPSTPHRYCEPDTDRDERLIRAAIQHVNQCSADVVDQCWPDLDYDSIIAAADRPEVAR